MEERNLAIVKSTYEGGNSEENGAALKRHVAPDVSWTEAAGFPYAGTYIGYEAILENVFERLATEWDDYRFVVDGYLSSGERVVAFGTYSGTYKQTGRSFNARVVHLWELVQEKIVRFEQFVDSKSVTDAM